MDGRLLNRALRAAAEARGLVIRHGAVDALILDGGAVTGVMTGGAPVAAGAAYSVSAQPITIAGGTAPGTYYLLFVTDATGSLFEDGQDGNNGFTPLQITVN